MENFKEIRLKHISNTPAIMTRLASNQTSVANGTETKLSLLLKTLIQMDFCINRFTLRYRSYFVSFAISLDVIDDGEYLQGYIYKNGAVFNDETMTRAFSFSKPSSSCKQHSDCAIRFR